MDAMELDILSFLRNLNIMIDRTLYALITPVFHIFYSEENIFWATENSA